MANEIDVKGWRVETHQGVDGLWQWDLRSGISSHGSGWEKTRIAAILAAIRDLPDGAVIDVPEASHAKPADPSWMVEVAREGCQARIRELGGSIDYLTGAYDSTEPMRSATHSLQLALSRGHVVVPRPMPSEEEILKAAREDAAQIAYNRLNPSWAVGLRDGEADDHDDVQIALQARRNMLREMGARPSNWMPPVKGGLVAGSMPREVKWDDALAEMARRVALRQQRPSGDRITAVEPSVDLEEALKRAWMKGFVYHNRFGGERPATEDNAAMNCDVSAILSTLPAKE